MCLGMLLMSWQSCGISFQTWISASVSFWTACGATWWFWMLWYIKSQRFSNGFRSGECEGHAFIIQKLTTHSSHQERVLPCTRRNDSSWTKTMTEDFIPVHNSIKGVMSVTCWVWTCSLPWRERGTNCRPANFCVFWKMPIKLHGAELWAQVILKNIRPSCNPNGVYFQQFGNFVGLC